MTLATSDLEGDLYYVHEDGVSVFKRPVTEFRPDGTEKGTQLGFLVCTADEFVDGAAAEIARSLNRLPKAEAMLVAAAGAIREFDEPSIALTEMADKIEEWMCA